MSLVPVTKAMLKKIDMASLIKGFEEDYKKLDDLKDFREDHEDRNAIMRWWDNDELEDAQLDAVELQASFSKKLGQLMVVAITQSQMLTQQQADLKSQQKNIQGQTQKIAGANKIIAKQQDGLAEQQDQLKKLIDDYFKLKGLTTEGAKKLILIAKDVELTKDQLLENVEQSIAGVHQLGDQLIKQLEEQANTLQQLESSIQARQESQANQIGVLSEKLQQQSLAHKETLHEIAEGQSIEVGQLNKVITQNKQVSEKNNTDLREEIAGFSSQFAEQKVATQAIVDKQHQKIQMLTIVAMSGFVLALSSIGAFMWQHNNLLGL
jgi:hypothetical protein